MIKHFKIFFKNEIFKNSNHWALLSLRVIPSFYMFFYHGKRKIIGGYESWEGLGKAALSLIGIEFGYIFFGFLAAISEGVLTWLIMFGMFTRLSSIFMIITMLFAGFYHLVDGDSGEMAIIYLTIYLVIFLAGPGKISLDEKLFKQQQKS